MKEDITLILQLSVAFLTLFSGCTAKPEHVATTMTYGLGEVIITINQTSIVYNIKSNESTGNIPSEISVKFKASSTSKNNIAIINKYNCTIIYQFKNRYYQLDIPDNATIPDMIRLFESESDVDSAGPTFLTHTSLDEQQECITEKEKSLGSMENYESGRIGVIFKDTVSENETSALLEYYNLEISMNRLPKYAVVNVDEGAEMEWMCMLEKNNIVKICVPLSVFVTMESYLVEYDKEILEEFDKGERWVRVIVRLNDSSDIDNILSNLSEDEFELTYKLSSGFSGDITKDGFTKLINDLRTSEVHIIRIGNISLDSNYTDCINKLKKDTPEYAEEQVVVVFKKDVSKEEAETIVKSYGLEIKSVYGWSSGTSSNHIVVKTPKEKEIETVCKFQSAKEFVNNAYLNYIMHVA